MIGITQEVLKQKIKQNKLSPSGYSPSVEVKKLDGLIIADLQIGYQWLTRTWEEFNNRTLQEEMNETARAFNTYIPSRREDPMHSWRAQTRRPILRNKLISTIAHATKATLIPGIYAYDPLSSEQDQVAAMSMKSMINWVIQNSDYAEQFVNFVTQVVSQPAGIFEIGYNYATRKIRDAEGNEKEVIDEELSGHYFDPVPCNELLIDNPYEPNIQRQRFVARRKLISFQEAKAVYGSLDNFNFVSAGVTTTVDTESGLFYSIQDPELEGRLVEEITYYNRLEDLEITRLNGIIIGNPFSGARYLHKSYPFAKSINEPINGGKFFWGKSQANKLLPDEATINTLRNMFIDGTFLQMMPSFAVFGDEQPGQIAMVPGAMNGFDEDVKIQNISPTTDARAGLLAMQEIEKSMIETSSDPFRSGSPQNLPDRMPAYSMAKLEENANTQLGLLMHNLMFCVTNVSTLLVSNILQYNTVPELSSGVDNDVILQYPSFVVEGEEEDGQEISKRLVFNSSFFAAGLTDKDLSRKILQKEGLHETDSRIIMINPEPFRNLKYKAFAGTDTMQQRNSILDKALKLEAYDRLIQDPTIQQDPESMKNVSRDFLIGAVAPGKAAKYMPGEQMTPALPESPQEEAPAPGGQESALLGQITGSNSVANMNALQNETTPE